MDRDTVVKLAREAGYDVDDDEILMPTVSYGDPSDETQELTRFATLVRNAALEEAALLCAHLATESGLSAHGIACDTCANNIRSLKE